MSVKLYLLFHTVTKPELKRSLRSWDDTVRLSMAWLVPLLLLPVSDDLGHLAPPAFYPVHCHHIACFFIYTHPNHSFQLPTFYFPPVVNEKCSQMSEPWRITGQTPGLTRKEGSLTPRRGQENHWKDTHTSRSNKYVCVLVQLCAKNRSILQVISPEKILWV